MISTWHINDRYNKIWLWLHSKHIFNLDLELRDVYAMRLHEFRYGGKYKDYADVLSVIFKKRLRRELLIRKKQKEKNEKN